MVNARSPVCLLLACLALFAQAAIRLENASAAESQGARLTRIEEIRALPWQEAQKAIPIRVEGVVTYSDPFNAVLRFLVIQDTGGGVGVVPRANQVFPTVGQRVRVEGKSALGGSAFVSDATLEPLGRAVLPEATRKSLSELADGLEDANWIETWGTVRSIGRYLGRLELLLHEEGTETRVRVLSHSQKDGKLARLQDAKVRVRGICITERDYATRQVRGFSVMLSSLEDLSVERPGPADLFALPVQPIAQLTTPENRRDDRVRIRGRITRVEAEGVYHVQDESAGAKVRINSGARLRAGDYLDATGYLLATPNGVHIENALYKAYAERPSKEEAGKGDPSNKFPPNLLELLTSAKQIMTLPMDRAGDGYPVRLRAVVTYHDPLAQRLFVQDESCGIFVQTGERLAALAPGTLVEVEGFSQSGWFAPVVLSTRLERSGKAPMPEPQTASIDSLLRGALDSQWVEMNGVIRYAGQQDQQTLLEYVTQGHRFRAVLPQAARAELPENLVGATVQWHGVCGTDPNPPAKLTGIVLFVPGAEHLAVVEPGPADPFDMPEQPIRELFRFVLPSAITKSLKVRGAVTYHRPGEGLVVRDATGSIEVETRQELELSLGDEVEVAGYASKGKQTQVIEDAIIRKLGPGPNPAASIASGALDNLEHASLVQITGHLASASRASQEQVLMLHSGNRSFPIHLKAGQPGFPIEPPAAGSLLQATGICVFERGNDQAAPAFRIRLRSAEDLRVLRAAPWWTTQHTLWSIGVMSALILAAAVWVGLLRQQVRQQTALIQKRFAEKMALEKKMQEAQKLESLGVMAGGVAHDFNNMLTAIIGHATMAQLVSQAHRSIHERLVHIEKTALQAADLCRQMLTFAGKARFLTKPCNLSAMVDEMKDLLKVSIHKKIDLYFRLAPDLFGSAADPAQIRQVILNLVINASDAIGDKPGSISIRTSSVQIGVEPEAKDYFPALPPPGEYACLEVADTGSGMTEETKAKIFEPFFSTKFTGRGLGLAAVLGIVRGHAGAMQVLSEYGKGSTFRLLLPRCRSAQLYVPAAGLVKDPAWRGSGAALVVDDEPEVRNVVGQMLQNFGFEVLLAENGESAVEIFQSAAERITVVLLDATMPKLNGAETYHRLKAIREETRIIFMSGFPEETVTAQVGLKGMHDFLQKPFAPDDLWIRLQSEAAMSALDPK